MSNYSLSADARLLLAGTALIVVHVCGIFGRAQRVQRRAAELGVSPDKVSGDDVELGLFSFWETDNLDKELPAGVGKASSGRSRRKGVLMSEADAKKLR